MSSGALNTGNVGHRIEAKNRVYRSRYTLMVESVFISKQYLTSVIRSVYFMNALTTMISLPDVLTISYESAAAETTNVSA